MHNGFSDIASSRKFLERPYRVRSYDGRRICFNLGSAAGSKSIVCESDIKNLISPCDPWKRDYSPFLFDISCSCTEEFCGI